jgi:hypothetical protein
MAEHVNHGLSGLYVCGADGVMVPADQQPAPEPEAKPAAKTTATSKESK